MGLETTDRLGPRVAELYAGDAQFSAAQPIRSVLRSARRTGLRLPQILETVVNGYQDRPALGWRAREAVTEPATGRRIDRLLPRFQTATYGDLWATVGNVASAWRRDSVDPLVPGSIVATIGFTSPDYLVVDLVCSYLGLVAVPLPHNAAADRLREILAEVEPQALAVGIGYLDTAVAAATRLPSLRRIVVFDHRQPIDSHREALQRARDRLAAADGRVVVQTLDEVAERGRTLTPVPMSLDGTDERLAMILYTSGSTGRPKGAMYTERMVSRLWTDAQLSNTDLPVLNVNYLPMNHIVSRLHLASCLQAGGTGFFVSESDLSTLFDDWKLVRPTDLGLVPAVVDLLFERCQREQRRFERLGTEPGDAATAAQAEVRDHLLGGRVVSASCTSAPLADEMWDFLRSCLQVPVIDGYGLTETGGVIVRNGTVLRPPVIDYRLADLPESGYFGTDRPYPRGELLVKTQTSTPGYYKRPDVTAAVFDGDGYYQTGDVMAETGPDQLAYVDRCNNVVKLAQGEFVAVAHLEAVFALAPLVHQIFVYTNSQRTGLLAVVVPTADAAATSGNDTAGLTAALAESLGRTGRDAGLAPWELPLDVLLESEPFSMANGLLSAAGKLLRPKLTERYGDRLEHRYRELASARSDRLRRLRDEAAGNPVLDTVLRAVQATLGTATRPDPGARLLDLGGDSLSALTLADTLRDIFGVEVPAGLVVAGTSDLHRIADFISDHIAAEGDSSRRRATFKRVHGAHATELRAGDLTLEKFVDRQTLAAAPTLRRSAGTPRTVLLTGANGYLGRFLCLQWLRRLENVDGRLVCIVRGDDANVARGRLAGAFDTGDPDLPGLFDTLAGDRLDVVAGDVSQPGLGLDQPTFDALSQRVDLIVHAAALVNHVLPYRQLFLPNVVGTAEVIRLALTGRIKPVSYLSTIAVGDARDPAAFDEDRDIRAFDPVRAIDATYANGYANSKWAGEVLLRQAHDLCRLPVAVFRCDMVLAHRRYLGQLNVPDSLTRLLFSMLATGLAPRSFYRRSDGVRPRAHYDGLPVDFIAAAVAALTEHAAQTADFRCFNVLNPHDDGVSLDSFVDWLVVAGHDIRRIDDYDDWLVRLQAGLRALPERQRRASVLPLIDAYRRPAVPLPRPAAPSTAFRHAVRSAKIDADGAIPHVGEELIAKYAADLHHLGLL